MDGLAGDALITRVSLRRLQELIWCELPAKEPVQPGLVAELAAVFDRTGMTHHAECCRSATTAEVLEAWERGAEEGRAAFVSARRMSGLVPPDVPSRPGRLGLVWGEERGPCEVAAFDAATTALEQALLNGRLRPQAPGWRLLQRAIVTECLEHDGLLDAVLAERISRWAGHGSPARNALVAPLVQRLLEPAAAPPGAGASVEPLGWLLRQIGAGTSLTRTERLPRRLAIKAAERFGWPHGGPEIAELYDLARRAGAVRRSAHRLFLTQTGHRLVATPTALWRAAAAELAPGEHGELVLVLMLSSGAASIAGLAEQVGDAGAVHAVLRPAQLLGVVTVAGAAVTLTDLGRAAALVALQRRATGQYPGAR